MNKRVLKRMEKMIVIPIFEFINLRRDELKNVQVKKRN